MTARHPPLSRLMTVLALTAAGLCWGAAHAEDDYAQVQRLLGRGQVAQALQQADHYIAAHPNDPQMRFIKAGALQAAGLTDKAEAILTQLTHDYPELAEPWNNLAVLYAARGQIDAAKTALDAALRIDPHYATALENLGDINLRLALRHYEQARQADPNAARLSAKIDATRRVIAGGVPAAAPAAAASQPAAASPQPAASQPQPAASQAEAAASGPANAASGPAAAASVPADAAPRPVAGNLPIVPTAELPPQPEVASSGPAGAASQPEAAASQAPAARP